MTTIEVRTLHSTLKPRTKEEYRSNWTDLRNVSFCQDWLDAGGVRTRSLHAGRMGDPGVIMLPGTGGHAETFTGNLGPYAEFFDTYAIDFLGHGYTSKPDYDYDMQAGAKFLVDFMQAVGFEKASYVGVSLGSWYALQFAYQHPEKVEKLVLVSPAGGPGSISPPGRAPTDTEQRPFEGGNLRQRAADNPTWEAAERILTGLIGPESITDDIIAARFDVSRQPGASAAMRHILWTGSIERRRDNILSQEQLRTINVPVLLLVGEPDDISKARVQPMADNLPNATLVYWEGVRHWPHWEDPAMFNEVSIPFLLST